MTYEFYITPEEYEIAAQNGISRKTLDYRVRDLAWKKEKALHHPVRKQRHDLKYWLAIAERHGVGKEALKSRRRRGMSLEVAATTPILSKEEAFKRRCEAIPRRFSDEELQTAKTNGVSRQTLSYRVIKLGWSRKDAINTPPLSKEEVLKRAQAASPFREMNEIYWNMRKKHPTEIEHRRDGNIHANQIQIS